MFRRQPSRELEKPPNASDPRAVEVLRAWTVPNAPQQVILRTTWKDPGAWGLMLADIARHAAQAYAREGLDPDAALLRIREVLELEWADPTDIPEDLTDRV